MVVVLVLLMVVVLGAVAVVATGRGGELGGYEPDRPPVRLPENRLVEARDVHRLRFPLAFRGYRMEDVDRVLDRLAAEIAERDRQLDSLGEQLFEDHRPGPAESAPLQAFRERSEVRNEVRDDVRDDVGDEVGDESRNDAPHPRRGRHHADDQERHT